MSSRTLLTGLVTLALYACSVATPTPSTTVTDGDPSSSSSAVRIDTITAGTRRDDVTKAIVDPRTTFHPKDHTILFNVQLSGVTEDTKAQVYWFIENDTGPFATYEVTATPDAQFAQFDLPRDNDWPTGTYTMMVEIGNTAKKVSKVFQFTIDR